MAGEWARPGKRCVCIDPHWWSDEPTCLHNEKPPALNQICLITAVYENGAFLELSGFDENVYETNSFRPLVPEDDIAAFRGLLNPTHLERLDRLAELLDL